MKSRIVLFVIACLTIGLVTIPQAWACSCTYMGNFAEYSKNQTVIRGEIVEYGRKNKMVPGTYQTMKVRVTDVITGEYPHRYISLEGDRGADCRLYISKNGFPKGESFLFSINKMDKKQPLSACGEAVVRIKDGHVIHSDPNDYLKEPISTPYAEFIAQLR